MQQTQQKTVDAGDDFMSRGELVTSGTASGMLPAITPTGDGDTAINIFGGVITAQRNVQKRDLADVKARLMALAAFAGMDYVYSWEVNDRKNNRKVQVEGATIVLANDLAREWGNCQVDCRVQDQGRHWMFYGRFVDLQTGYSLTRGYQQRKAQDTGMKDDQRALDLVFQIGQSKCIRNVVVNALRTMADFCVEEAKKGLLVKVKGNPDGARKAILAKAEVLGIDVKRINVIYTRTADNWTIYDMAKIWTEINSIADGMAAAEDVYPSEETRQANGASNGTASDTSTVKKDPPAENKAVIPDRKVMLDDGTDLNLQLVKIVEAGEIVTTGAGVKYEVVKFDRDTIVVKAVAAADAKPAATKKAAAKKTGATNLDQQKAGDPPPADPPATDTTPPAAPRPNLFGGDDE